MSEEHLARIEASIAGLRAEMATKADIAQLRAEMATKADLEAAIASVRAEMATKADLEAAIAGVAKNVDVMALGQLVKQLSNDVITLKNDIRILSAFNQQVVSMVSGFGDALRGLTDQQSHLGERMRELEARET
jgi:hypothetical protein